MDEFCVLTERYGLKPQGKSAPMAASRRPPPTTKTTTAPRSSSNSDYAAFLDDQTGFFQPSSGDFGDFLGAKPSQQPKVSSFNLDSMFSGPSGANTTSFPDDVFGGMPALNVKDDGGSVGDDLLGGFATATKQSAPKNDSLIGDLGGVRQKLQSMNSSSGNKGGEVRKNVDDSGDLLPGFGQTHDSNNGNYTQRNRPQQSTVNSVNLNFSSPMEDPFVVLESGSTPDYLSELEQISKQKNSGGVKDGGSLNNEPQMTPSEIPGSIKKTCSTNDIFDDLFRMDGDIIQPKVVQELNQHNLRTQQEQEEKHRIAETMDAKVKSWAAGKEGNMRALLSSLQSVLWPGCGWEPVGLTDLITSASVKKVYKRAALYIHPDKVQRASLQQKYIAEKVFYLLQEAMTKLDEEKS